MGLGVNEEINSKRGPLQHQVENVPTNGQQMYLKVS